MDRDVMTTLEAARELGISAQRVRDLIKAGRLPAERFGNYWLIKREDLDRVRVRKPGRPKGSTKS